MRDAGWAAPTLNTAENAAEGDCPAMDFRRRPKLAYSTKEHVTSPFPFTFTTRLSVTFTCVLLAMRWATAGVTWSRLGSPFVSMRAAKFIVSPKKQKCGRLSPMTPPNIGIDSGKTTVNAPHTRKHADHLKNYYKLVHNRVSRIRGWDRKERTHERADV